MVTESVPAGRTEVLEEAPLTQHVAGLCFAVMAVGDSHRVGLLLDGATTWLTIPDEALRAEVWRLLGHRIEVWSRDGVVYRAGTL